MIKTVIFDIGNVLMAFDYMPYIRELLGDEDVIRHVNAAIWHTGYWNDLDRGHDIDTVIQRMLDADPEYQPQIRETLENVGRCMHKADYAIPWIRELKARGFQVLYLSNYSQFTIDANPDVLDFLPDMDGGIFSYTVGVIKPDPAIFQEICDRYNLVPEECVFLDDNDKNIESACAFGMNGILFKDYKQGRAQLEKLLHDGSPVIGSAGNAESIRQGAAEVER